MNWREKCEWDFRLYTKETAQKTILNPKSGHPQHVLKFWPKSEIRRFSLRNSGYIGYNSAKQQFIAKLYESYYPKSLIKQLNQLEPEHFKKKEREIEERSSLEQEIDASQISHNPVKKEAIINWSIPYHPEIKKMGLQKQVNDILSMYYGEKIKVRIAWRNVNTNLSAKLRMMIIKGKEK